MMWKQLKVKNPRNLKDELEIRPATIKEYKKLVKFHYITAQKPAIIKGIYGAYYNNLLLGVIVYSVSSLESYIYRYIPELNIINGLNKRDKAIKKAEFINKNIENIARIILHPSIRGIGFSKKFMLETAKLRPVRYITIISQMLYYFNFLPKEFLYKKRIVITNQFKYKSSFGGKISVEYGKRFNKIIKRIGYGLLDKKKLGV